MPSCVNVQPSNVTCRSPRPWTAPGTETAACEMLDPSFGVTQFECANVRPRKVRCSTHGAAGSAFRSPFGASATSVSSRGAMTSVLSGDSPGMGMYVSSPVELSRYHSPGESSASATLSTRKRVPALSWEYGSELAVRPVKETTSFSASTEAIRSIDVNQLWKLITSTSPGLRESFLIDPGG